MTEQALADSCERLQPDATEASQEADKYSQAQSQAQEMPLLRMCSESYR